MSKDYNFDEISEQDGPTVKMGGHTYKLVYPTVEDIEKIQGLKTDQEQTDAIYAFLKPESADAPPFKDVIRKANVKVIKAFSEMVKAEFGVE